MADESTDPLVIPEENDFDNSNPGKNCDGNPASLNNGLSTHGHRARASTGSYSTGGSSRNSTGEPDSAKHVPHYLRASTGSCHDFCKYGKPHAFEEKARKRLPKKTAKPLRIEQIPVEIFVSGKQKEKSVKPKPSANEEKGSRQVKPSPDTSSRSPKSRSSFDAKSCSFPRHNASLSNQPLLSNHKPTPTENVIPVPSEKTEVPAREGVSIDNKMSKTKKKTDNQSTERFSPLKSKKQVKVQPSSSSANIDGGSEKERSGSDIKTGKKVTTSRVYLKRTLALSVAPWSPKLSLSRIASSKAKKAGKLPIKDLNGVETGESNNEVPEKTLYVIKTESVQEDHSNAPLQSPSSPKSLSRGKSPSLLSRDGEKGYSGNETNRVKTKLVKENQASGSSSGKKTLRKSKTVVAEDIYCSPLKLKFRNGKVVDIQSDNSAPRRLTFRRARTDVSQKDKTVTDNNRSVKTKNLQPVKENKEKTLIKSRVVSENKYRSPVKISRSGKGADPHSDHNSPWRLKFRRTFKKAGNKDDASGAVLPSRKVVLKHRNVQQGKKDTQVLFNNVIEETASKLVETRKSKVKALVGAFESVISLQERKPSLLGAG